MKKGMFKKRIAVVLLAFTLIMSNSLYLYAEEPDYTEPSTEQEGESGTIQGDTDEPAVNTPGNDDEGEPSEEAPTEEVPSEPDSREENVPVPGKKISIDKEVLSFGTIKTTEKPRPLSFIITNESIRDDIDLSWSQTDTSGLFILNMPSEAGAPLSPGRSIQGSIEIDSDKAAPGDYATTLIFSDVNTNAEVKTDVSVKIEKPAPSIDRIRIWPGSTNLRQGDTQEFNVSVEGENDPDTSVSWKVQGQNSGDTYIESNGILHVASDETAGTLTVIVTSNLNSNYKDTASVGITKDKYIVNARVNPSDGGYVTGKGTYNGGDRATLTATAETGYRFLRWENTDGDIISNSSSYTTDRIKGDIKLVAVFEQSDYLIKVKSADKDMGTVEGGGYVEKGDSTYIEAKPKKGCVFDGWYEHDKLLSKDKKVKIRNVKKDHTFIAEFRKEDKEDKYLVNVSPHPSEGGRVSGSGMYKKGSDVDLKATPEKGYHFKGYVLNNKVISESPDFKIKDIDRDLSVTAYFEKDGAVNHMIKSGVGNKGGVITPSGETLVTEGNTITYAIAPDNGYGVLMVSVDGEQVGAVTSFTFKNVKKDHTISVVFAPKENSVNNVKMDKIISTEEAEKLAVAKLKDAAPGSEGRESEIITPEMYAEMKKKETEGEIDEIVVPEEQNLIGMDETDNLKDVVDSYNPDTATGVYQSLDITKETAEKMIDSGEDGILINEAYELGILDIIVNNEYMAPGHEGDVLDLTNNHTVKNLQEVIRACLTKEEKLMMLEGKEIVISFSISGAENPGEYEKDSMKDAKGVSIDRYLYITLIKTIDGVPVLVEELASPMQIVMEIPEDLRDPDKKFCIVRNHNGQVDILEDMDNDPDTITVMTDRFSPYAMGHFSTGSNITFIIIIISAAFALTLLVLAAYINMRDKKRKRGKTA